MIRETTGHCLFRAVRFADEGTARWTGYCHCDSCRRATASPVTAYVGVPDGQWRWTGATPSRYTSSPGTEWMFCATCGTRVAYASDRHSGEIHFFAALLDRPQDYTSERHYHHEERLNWLSIADDLPKRTG